MGGYSLRTHACAPTCTSRFLAGKISLYRGGGNTTQFSFIKNTSDFKTFCEAFVVEFYLKLRLILRIITYLTYICWEINNFVIKSDILADFSFVRIFLKNYRVTMTTTLDTSCSENTMVLSARRGFLHACIF